MVLRDRKNNENEKKMTLTSQGLSKNILPDRQKLPKLVKNNEKWTAVIPPKIIFFWFKLIDTARKWCLGIGKTLKMQKK